MSWTESETEYLQEHYRKIPIEEISEYLGKKPRTIIAYANRHGLGKRNWTEEEIDYLEKWYGRKSYENIAKELNRTVHAVKVKASKLGFGPVPLYSGNLTVCDVSRLTSKSTSTIILYWLKEGLVYKRFGNYILITQEHLGEWMRDHPDMWDATQCDAFYFEQYEWFHKKMLDDRLKKHNARWNVAM